MKWNHRWTSGMVVALTILILAACGGSNGGGSYTPAPFTTENQKLLAPDAQAGDEFGFSVAISGGDAIVGAVGDDGGAVDPLSNAGAAYIFK